MKPGNFIRNRLSQHQLRVHNKGVEEHPPFTPNNR